MNISSFKNSNHAVALQKIIEPILTWDDVWIDYEYSVENNSLIKKRSHGIVTHTAHLSIPKVKDLCIKYGFADAHIYTAFSKQDSGSGEHFDSMDVLYIQCIGETTWIVDNSNYDLAPGDGIFVPKGMRHNVISKTPRVGLSIGL